MVAISRNLSNKHSMEMLLTGELISSDKASKIGLINDVVEKSTLKDFVLNKAQKISKKSSVTLKIGKEAFYKQLDMKLSDAYDYASKVMAQNMLKLDAKEGIDAFIDKREPIWKDK
jgi:enoyl-CoA hydratase/carnithine racemase|tara:strand:+ start:67 stop:414 length:348 start_codon:yes stop_codon:yes gene_type:complete